MVVLRPMADEQEESETDGEEGDKLGMGARHPIAFAVHF